MTAVATSPAHPDAKPYMSPQVSFDGGMFMVTYITGVVESWMYWPMIAGAVFLFKYKKKKALFEQEHPGQVSMAWPLSRKVRKCCVFLFAAMFIRSYYMQLRRSCGYLYTKLHSCLRMFDSALCRRSGGFGEDSLPAFTSGGALTGLCIMQLIISHRLQLQWTLNRRPMEAY